MYARGDKGLKVISVIEPEIISTHSNLNISSTNNQDISIFDQNNIAKVKNQNNSSEITNEEFC